MGACSLKMDTRLGDDTALAWHASDGSRRLAYHSHRVSLRARAPEQPSSMPSWVPHGPSRRGRATDVGERSLGAATVLGGDEALAWRAPGDLL